MKHAYKIAKANVLVVLIVCFTSVIKDSSKGVTEEWERFDFNKDAPLDGDAKQDYFGGRNLSQVSIKSYYHTTL